MIAERKLATWAPFGAWIVVIFALSSMPSLDTSDVGVPLLDKLAHIGVYGILGILFARAAGFANTSIVRLALTAAAVGLGVGILDELYQGVVPGRHKDALDAVADLLGAGLGGLAWGTWLRRKRGAPQPSRTQP